MDAILHKDSMGGGDIKLFAVMGLYLGPAGSLFALMLSCLFGLLFALLRRTGGEKGEQIPFGPSIAAATAFMLLWGETLVQWYLGLLRL
jgi:leader peptidase (prepilin peptidase)/N-methyltransferase